MTIYVNITPEQADERLAECVPDHGEVIVLRNLYGSFAVYTEECYAAARRAVRDAFGTASRYTLAYADARRIPAALATAGCIEADGALKGWKGGAE